MASLNYLTEDFIVEILSWLPVNSLTRFKCLNKSLFSLIGQHQFVTKQLHNHVRSANSENNLCNLLLDRICSDTPNENFEDILSLLAYDEASSRIGGDDFPFLVKTLNLPFYIDIDTRSLTIMDSCDGIVCLGCRSRIVISNPGIREFKVLPKTCICFPPPVDSFDYYGCIAGLGYDPEANDYKIVQLWDIFISFTRVIRVEVYTLSTDSWREIDNYALKVEINGLLMEVEIRGGIFNRSWNGAYYWYAQAIRVVPEARWSLKRRNAIVVFDMTYEIFQCILMPESCEDQDDVPASNFSLLELNGSLALFQYPVLGEEKSFDIWAMEEFGVNGIWMKILSIGPLLGIEKPLLFVNSDFLLMEGKGVRLVSYNLKTKQVKRLPIYGKEDKFQAIEYKQSLLAIHGGKRVDN
ncbi:hypothetical protein SLA2020_105800 [Shorea laevis]